MSPSRLVRLFAALAVLVIAPTTATAATATAAPPNALGTLEIRYNAGDADPEHGPNSFVITVGDCPPMRYVEYKWGSHYGKVSAPCGETTVSSLAPLGATAYPLQWRHCSVTLWRSPPRLHTVCHDYHQDVVLTD
ncbi:hypothetical protein [Saccharothrix stipae]